MDRSVGADPVARRDPAIAEAYVREALVSDPESGRTTPPSLRAPLGALEDSFLQASGRRLYDAGSITAAVLLVRGGADFWSRPEDVQAFAHDAVHARSVRAVEIPGATHFLHLERAGAGRAQLLELLGKRCGDPGRRRRGAHPAQSSFTSTRVSVGRRRQPCWNLTA